MTAASCSVPDNFFKEVKKMLSSEDNVKEGYIKEKAYTLLLLFFSIFA